MNFRQAIGAGFQKYFDFKTRSMRSEYWWFFLFAVLVSWVATILDGVFGGWEAAWSDWTPLNTVANLVLLIPGISIACRRLHDINRSGWWQLIVFTIIGIIPLIYWLVQPGTKGPNRYGPEPILGSEESQTAGVPLGGLPSEPITYAPSSAPQNNQCGECGGALNPEARFCESCGAPYTPSTQSSALRDNYCGKCGEALRPEDRFCRSCGVAR